MHLVWESAGDQTDAGAERAGKGGTKVFAADDGRHGLASEASFTAAGRGVEGGTSTAYVEGFDVLLDLFMLFNAKKIYFRSIG